MQTRKRTQGVDLDERERWAFVAMILQYEPPPKVMKKTEICELFQITDRTGRRIMEEYRESIEKGEFVPDLSSDRLGNCGRSSDLTETLQKRLRKINKDTRGELTLRAFAAEYEKRHKEPMALVTLSRYCDEMGFHKVRSYLKPSLTVEQKIWRLEFILQKKDLGFRFKLELYVIHVDEKWFYLTQDKKSIRIHPDDEPYQYRRVQHKSHIGKIMFLSAIGVPHRTDDDQVFDGKIGIWDFTIKAPALKNSKNRPKGTIITNPVSVNADEYFNKMVLDDGVLPTIRKNLPWLKGKKL
jgi:hypothetical protein